MSMNVMASDMLQLQCNSCSENTMKGTVIAHVFNNVQQDGNYDVIVFDMINNTFREYTASRTGGSGDANPYFGSSIDVQANLKARRPNAADIEQQITILKGNTASAFNALVDLPIPVNSGISSAVQGLQNGEGSAALITHYINNNVPQWYQNMLAARANENNISSSLSVDIKIIQWAIESNGAPTTIKLKLADGSKWEVDISVTRDLLSGEIKVRVSPTQTAEDANGDPLPVDATSSANLNNIGGNGGVSFTELGNYLQSLPNVTVIRTSGGGRLSESCGYTCKAKPAADGVGTVCQANC